MRLRDFMRTEFIGLEVGIDAPSCYTSISGKVVDETKNTLSVRSGAVTKMVPKKGTVFRFSLDGVEYVVDGTDINHRPEDRIKKVR